jgi:hypothetical protein
LLEFALEALASLTLLSSSFLRPYWPAFMSLEVHSWQPGGLGRQASPFKVLLDRQPVFLGQHQTYLTALKLLESWILLQSDF